MTQCLHGIHVAELGAWFNCPQQVEGHREAHGPFHFWFHYLPDDNQKVLGWPSTSEVGGEKA